MHVRPLVGRRALRLCQTQERTDFFFSGQRLPADSISSRAPLAGLGSWARRTLAPGPRLTLAIRQLRIVSSRQNAPSSGALIGGNEVTLELRKQGRAWQWAAAQSS